MKAINDLTKSIKDSDYYVSQFKNSGIDRNILFINPQLSGKQLYKVLLPYLSMYNTNVYTAITDLLKYNENSHIIDLGNLDKIKNSMIEWADVVVFPFTTLNLIGYYQKIKSINNRCDIVFNIDFNFYELPESHPYKKHITPESIKAIHDNIWFADIVLVSNVEFAKYLFEKLKVLGETDYKGIPTKMFLNCMPLLFDAEILLQNIDYNPQQPVINDRPMLEKLDKTVEEIKSKIDLNEKPKKNKTTKKGIKKGAVYIRSKTGGNRTKKIGYIQTGKPGTACIGKTTSYTGTIKGATKTKPAIKNRNTGTKNK